MSYDRFIAAKSQQVESSGFDFDPHAQLFPFQRAIVRWALRRGRAAVFADCGLGKTAMQLSWATAVAERHGRVLILTPLAVAEQTVREATHLDFSGCAYLRADDRSTPIVVTNYEMLEHFDPALFAGVVLDESSILKSYTGAIRNAIIQAFARTPYRLAATATPAPNDHSELGNHAEFLGVKSRVEMLSEFFTHDGGDTSVWRLKRHAYGVFWRWVSEWAVFARSPADIGFSDDGYRLPELRYHQHVIPVDHREAWASGMLFALDTSTLAEQRATRRATISSRIAKAAEIVNADDEPAIVWCELNDEADAATAAIRGAVQVAGADAPEAKASAMLSFADGSTRVLVSKPSIAGFGLNFQHCARQIFVGASHSWEQTYQAIRRSWRFGQRRPVDVHMICSETDGAIVANYRRKDADAATMAAELLALVGLTNLGGATSDRWNPYEPRTEMVIPQWLS